MAAKLCSSVIDGKECGRELTREPPGELMGFRVYSCPLGHISYERAGTSNPTGYGVILFRRAMTGDTWHFFNGCSQWPTTDFHESDNAAISTPLCGECLAKSRLES